MMAFASDFLSFPFDMNPFPAPKPTRVFIYLRVGFRALLSDFYFGQLLLIFSGHFVESTLGHFAWLATATPFMYRF
jgi:hypothetical protein